MTKVGAPRWILGTTAVLSASVAGHEVLRPILGMLRVPQVGGLPLLFDGCTATVTAGLLAFAWARPRSPARVLLAIFVAAYVNTLACALLSMSATEGWRFGVHDVLNCVLFVSTVGALLWVPVGALFALGLAPLFRAASTLERTPGRDQNRRAVFASGAYALGVALVVGLAVAVLVDDDLDAAHAQTPAPLLALAASALLAAVSVRDWVDLVRLGDVREGRYPGLALRDASSFDALPPLLPFVGGASTRAPSEVLVARQLAGAGPFRDAVVESPLYTLADARPRLVRRAALSGALALIALAASIGLAALPVALTA